MGKQFSGGSDIVDKKSEGRISTSTLKSMSVEPAGFLALMSLVICHLIFQNLMMQTICQVDLQYPEDKCTEIINKVNATYKTEEREIQKIAAGVQAFTSVIFSTVTILVVLFVGPWSDSNGRRVPLLMSMFGLMSFSLMSLLCYFLMGKLTAIQLSLLALLPVTISGGGVVFTMSAYSYISDTTTPKNRTVRTGILSAAVRSGTPLGFAVGGALTKFGVGMVHSLLISAALGFVAFLILLFTVKSIKPVDKEVESRRDKRSAWIRYNPLTKLVQAFAILFKKREERHIFWILILCYVCYAAPGPGEYSMLYLFVRERLSWGIGDYGFFSMCNWLMSAVGVVLSMFILSRKLKISDPVVGFVGGISQICGSSLYAITTTPVMMYMASALDMMNGTIGVIVRSMLSKTVKPDEVGKMFALLGVLESLLPLVMVPAYAMLYRSTATVFAGAFFFLSAAVTLPAEVIFLYFMCRKKTVVSVDTVEHRAEDGEGSLDKAKMGSTKDLDDDEDEKLPEMVTLMPSEIYSSKDAVMGVFETGPRRHSNISNISK